MLFDSIDDVKTKEKTKYKEPSIEPKKQDSKNTAKEAQLSYKEEAEKEREKAITGALESVAKSWSNGANGNQNLKKHFAYCIMFFLGVQICGLLYLTYKISLTTVQLRNIGAYSLYISGVFGQMFYLPKAIADNLFPKEEQNHLIALLKLLKEKENKS